MEDLLVHDNGGGLGGHGGWFNGVGLRVGGVGGSWLDHGVFVWWVEGVKDCLESCVLLLSDVRGCVRRINLGKPHHDCQGFHFSFTFHLCYINIHRH